MKSLMREGFNLESRTAVFDVRTLRCGKLLDFREFRHHVRKRRILQEYACHSSVVPPIWMLAPSSRKY